MTNYGDMVRDAAEASRRRNREGCLTNLALIALVLTIMGLFVLWRASNKAEAFERVTGQHVSTWDAIFLDLRVQEPTLKDADGQDR